MEAVKKPSPLSENQLRFSEQQVGRCQRQKLTKNNPTMKAKFDALLGVVKDKFY